MSAANRGVLAILLLGNLLLWGGRAGETAADARFDFAAFEADVRRSLADLPLARVRFAENGLLPDAYLCLETPAGAATFVSVYAGHYPRRGLLAKEPHDPAVCYPVAGWDLAAGPVELEAGAAGALTRIEVERDGRGRLALYWTVHAVRGGGGAASLWRRFAGLRGDYVWVRIELEPPLPEGPLDPGWTERVARVRAAAEAALGGGGP
jgi:hypothetical protein